MFVGSRGWTNLVRSRGFGQLDSSLLQKDLSSEPWLVKSARVLLSHSAAVALRSLATGVARFDGAPAIRCGSDGRAEGLFSDCPQGPDKWHLKQNLGSTRHTAVSTSPQSCEPRQVRAALWLHPTFIPLTKRDLLADTLASREIQTQPLIYMRTHFKYITSRRDGPIDVAAAGRRHA